MSLRSEIEALRREPVTVTLSWLAHRLDRALAADQGPRLAAALEALMTEKIGSWESARKALEEWRRETVAHEPEIGSLDLESETPCCIQMAGEKCFRHGPAVARPAPEGCAGCAARDRETLNIVEAAREVWLQATRRALPDGWEWGVHPTEMTALKDALRKYDDARAASPKESRRHE